MELELYTIVSYLILVLEMKPESCGRAGSTFRLPVTLVDYWASSPQMISLNQQRFNTVVQQGPVAETFKAGL